MDDDRMPRFDPQDITACASEWQDYKRQFEIHLDAKGLFDAVGRRKVGQLLKCMGREHVTTYDTFTFAPRIPAVVADDERGIAARPEVPAEDRYNLNTVFEKFDAHFGVHRYRSIKRQDFLSCTRGPKQTVQSFIAELKRKAQHCDYGDREEGLIVDMLINRVHDPKCTEKLMELPDEELTLNNAIRVCRQVELTNSHLKALNSVKNEEHVHTAYRGRSNSRSRGSRRQQADRRDRRYQEHAQPCDRCCREHNANGKCPASDRFCGTCGEKGHYFRSPLCRANKSRRDNPQGSRGFRRQFRGKQQNTGRGRSRYRDVHYADDYYDDEYIYDDGVARNDVDEDCDDLCEAFDDMCETKTAFLANVNVIPDVHEDKMSPDGNINVLSKDVNNAAKSVSDDCNKRCVTVDDCNKRCVTVDDCSKKCVTVDDCKQNVTAKECNKDVDCTEPKCDVSTNKGVEKVNSKLHDMFDDADDVFIVTTEADVNKADDDWSVDLSVLGAKLCVEIDTGAKCNILSLTTLQALKVPYVLGQKTILVTGVHGESERSLGDVTLPCKYNKIQRNITFNVMDGKKPVNLLGRNECVNLGLVKRVHVTVDDACKDLVTRYADVFTDSIGCMPGEYEINVDESVSPVIHASRSVPAALRKKVKDELGQMERDGILAKVTEPTPWVSSMVVVKKKDKDKVRICIDPSDLNKAIQREHFPMNSIDDIATRLCGSKYFTTLDANKGYFHIKLTERSSFLTTFNTPFGRYRYLRMPMGAKCSADKFQAAMVSAFGSIEGVEVVVDDLLIHGATLKEHNERLKKVLERCQEINLKLNKSKCQIGQKEVNYVGHKLTGEGLKPTDERIRAITNMQPPTDVKELETVLGMVAYVAKFIPNLSELTAPLRELKKKEVWTWTEEQQEAYDTIKRELTSEKVLKYYNMDKPLLLSVDASTKGLGAAVIQDNGVVAYASRALTTTEQKYAQIEKEMLAVVFGCTKFHKLLYGKDHVTVESDHKPLESLMNKPMSASPMRIQRMRLKLQPYSFKLIHVSGKSIGLADCLSRFPQERDKQDEIMNEDLMVCKADTVAFRWHDVIEDATKKDENLQTLRKVIFNGWPENKQDMPDAVMPYWNIRDELSTYNGIVFKGERIVIPESLRAELLEILHKSHSGIVKTKQRAREMIYWPGLNKQIEDITSKCAACLESRPKQQKEPLNAHPIPSLPWNKVGTDLFEHEGDNYLILVDYFSNFIEVVPLRQDTKSETVIKHIKMNIARYGIMETLISDNGPQYSSAQFADFTKSYGINHVTSSPIYPQSNGLAEKSVQTVKNLITKCKATGDDIYLALLDLRNTPRDDVTGSPMQRLQGRRAQTRLPIAESQLIPKQMKPAEIHDKMMEYRKKQKIYYDRSAKPLKPIQTSDSIRVHSPKGWQPAELIDKHELPNSYVIKAGSQGRLWRRNRKDLMITNEQPHVIRRPQREIGIPPQRPPRRPPPEPPLIQVPRMPEVAPEPIPQTQVEQTLQLEQRPQTRRLPRPQPRPQHQEEPRRPRRATKPPVWMKDYST